MKRAVNKPNSQVNKSVEDPELDTTIVDVHVHIFPDRFFDRIWKYFEKHYWPVAYKKYAHDLAKILRTRVSRYTTLCYAHKPSVARELNEFVLNYAQKHPEAIPVGTFHLEDKDLESYVEEAVSRGIKGFKVHLEVQNFDPAHPRLRYVYKLMAEAGCVLHIHSARTPVPCEWTGVAHFRRVVKMAPDLKIVVAHGGYPEFEEYLILARDHPVYFDLAMVGVDFPLIWDIPETQIETIARFPDKFAFGSDFPNIPYQWEKQVETVRSWNLGAEAESFIFWRTAATIYGLPSGKRMESRINQ